MNSITQQLDTVVALFKSHTQAEQAVKELQKAGFDMKQFRSLGVTITPRNTSSAITMPVIG